MTGKDVYLQMTWSWPDKTWHILCSYCLQWNTSQSKFRNHYFLFLFAFSILSQLFLIWGCSKALADWRPLYEFKCCCFKQQVLRQDKRTLIGSHLHSSQIATCCVSGEVYVWKMRALARLHEFTESERIRKIIWIIFSAINNINSALHITQPYCILTERTAAATHHHLDYFWFWHFAINKLL